MKIDVFISWSGKFGNELADVLKSFLESAFPGTDAFFSTQDIKGGDVGINSLTSRLRRSNFAFLLLTPESYESPWVLFEAGCVFSSISGRVFPVLCGIEQSALARSPLGQIQCREFTKKDLFDIVRTINKELVLGSHPLHLLDGWMEAAWERFELSKFEDRVRSTEVTPTSPVSEQIAEGIIGQGELATMNRKDLVKVIEDVIQKKNEDGYTIDGGHF